jgi:hypothetical protein
MSSKIIIASALMLTSLLGVSQSNVLTVLDEGNKWNSYKKWDKKVKTYATFFNLLNSVSTSTGVL